jgi:hypothetical protein
MASHSKHKTNRVQSDPLYNRVIIGVGILSVFVICLVIAGSLGNRFQKKISDETSPEKTTVSSGSALELRVERSDNLTSAPTDGTLLQGSSLGSELKQDSQNIQSSQSPQNLQAPSSLQGSGQD